MDAQTPPTELQAKRQVGRYYVRDGVLIRRVTGEPDIEIISLGHDKLPVHDLMVEGLVSLFVRGESLDNILSGKGIPDRSPPAEKVTRDRPLTLLQRAVLAVREVSLVKATRAAGGKVDKAAIAAEAERQVRALSAEDLKRAEKLADVQVELAKQRGGSGSVDELFRTDTPPAPPPEDVA